VANIAASVQDLNTIGLQNSWHGSCNIDCACNRQHLQRISIMSHITLDTPETLKALTRSNYLAKARRVALNRIMYEVRTLHSTEAIKASVEALLVELATVEQNITAQ